jgi:DEAD/DEAH box helicase domain-containing protein
MIDDLFCPTCGRLKRRCICKKERRRQKNLKLVQRRDLIPLFDTEDEIVLHRAFQPFNSFPSVPVERLGLPKQLEGALKKREIEKLYPFQMKAIEALREGKNVVITAPTGFGKTEAFAIPMLERVASDGKAIVVYPTKALARDQESKLKFYASSLSLQVVRFDGDSNQQERRTVLSGKADIILSNPDMVDYHLRNTQAFRDIAEELRFLAFDELHIYVGLLGSNLHYLAKRLSRFADFQIACASATIANAKEFAEELFEKSFVHIHGEHRKNILHFIMRYTPSIYMSIRDIAKSLPNKKLLIFGNSYKSVETAAWVLNKGDVRAAVHKSGLPKTVRESVERAFRDGKLRVVVATPTLELGIDVGDVDVVVSELVSYSQFLQRVGRAGRKGQESIGVLLLREEDSISTYYKTKPDDYFKDVNFGYVEKLNEDVMRYQLCSMCMESPLLKSEIKQEWQEAIEWLKQKGLIVELDGEFIASSRAIDFLANFSMRGIGEAVKMIKNGEVVGERVLPIALKELFPGSIIIHNGERLRSVSLDLKKKEAVLESTNGKEITDPLYTSLPRITRVEGSSVDAAYCSLEITMSIYGYIERDMFSREKKNIHYLNEPVSYTFATKGFIFAAPFPADDFAGTFHALEHVLIESSDVLTGGGSQQMGGISTPEGDIFVYDATLGGSGLSKLLFKRLEQAFKIAYDVLKNCNCERIDGCPKCTYSYQCGNNNQPLNKIGAMNVLELILNGEKRDVEVEKYKEIAEFQYFP